MSEACFIPLTVMAGTSPGHDEGKWAVALGSRKARFVP
jgi:hypothetical protein